MRRHSPFRPTFGISPPWIAGRDPILSEIGEALDAGPGRGRARDAVHRESRYGQDGDLNQVEDLARERSWLVVSETATRGLLDRLAEEAFPALAEVMRHGPREQTRVSGVTLPAGLGGIELDLPPIHPSATEPRVHRGGATCAD